MKKKGEAKQGEKTYQIRPLFKDKFRPQVSLNSTIKYVFMIAGFYCKRK